MSYRDCLGCSKGKALFNDDGSDSQLKLKKPNKMHKAW